MQCKSILLLLTFGLSGIAGYAQPRKLSGAVKIDTIVVKQAQCSIFTPAPNAPKLVKKESAPVPAPLMPVTKQDVPLAGESYYGDKNPYVTEFVRKYLTAHNKTLNVVQDKSTPHFSLMDNVLKQHDIPKQLKYLAVIESALNNKAISRAGAVGPWQLMAPTARLLGLTVNHKRDDRKDWYKSTDAAAKYLTQLYDNLNDWLLVVAAYNSGPAPVQRAITRTGSHNFWDIKQYLPRETQGHVLAFIATATIFENMSNFIGIGSLPADFAFGKKALVPGSSDNKTIVTANNANNKPKGPVFSEDELKNMAIVKLKEPLSFDLMALELSIDKKLLDKWNPDYELFVYDTYGSESYNLRIPKDKLENFVSKKEFLARRSKQIFSAQL